MTVGLDTSIVVRLLVGEPANQCQSAWRLLQAEFDVGRPVLVADLVVAEAFFVLRHHYGVPTVTALRTLAFLLGDRRITGESASGLLSTHHANFDELGDDFIDRLIHRHYLDAGRTFFTFDKNASRLPGAKLLKS